MGDLFDFERGQIICVHLAGASVTKTDILLGVLRATISKVILAYTNCGKTISAKRKRGQKSTLAETDHCTFRRTASKNHTTTAAQVN
jgi:hypothetical protein